MLSTSRVFMEYPPRNNITWKFDLKIPGGMPPALHLHLLDPPPPGLRPGLTTYYIEPGLYKRLSSASLDEVKLMLRDLFLRQTPWVQLFGSVTVVEEKHLCLQGKLTGNDNFGFRAKKLLFYRKHNTVWTSINYCKRRI